MHSVLQHTEKLGAVVAEQPYPLLFVTVSGAHLYGFPSPDSDFDLRGVHVLPAQEVVGLETGRETVEVSEMRDGLEIDLVSHDAKKFFALMLKTQRPAPEHGPDAPGTSFRRLWKPRNKSQASRSR